MLTPELRALLRRGTVIPAHPLALRADRRLDEERQRGLTAYYAAAGAGGIAVAVHTTQFSIREHGLLRPVLELAADVCRQHAAGGGPELLRVAGICGPTPHAVAEAELARELGYHLGLLSLAALPEAGDDELLSHAAAVGEVLPLFGFYLQPAVGGRPLGRAFWRRFAALPAVEGIKIAPFDRYRTLDVVRGVAESERHAEVALYTGNDDSIVHDLLTPFDVDTSSGRLRLRMVGGLLGHWAVATGSAVRLLRACHAAVDAGSVSAELLALAPRVTDCNAAVFDAHNGYAGCIPGIHEVLRRHGLLAGTFCLDPAERLSPGQAEAIDRVCRQHADLLAPI